MKKIINFDLLILFVLIILGITVATLQGQDSNWDLANYHYYSSWALFHNRIGYDIMPCGIQSYLNPLSDMPFYFLVKYLNNFPFVITSILSLYWSFSAFLTYKIAKNFFNVDCPIKNLLIFFSVIVGISGIVSIVEAGTTFNDLNINIFVLGSLYIFSNQLFANDSNKRTILLAFATFLLGFATGMKPSASIFSIAIFISMFFMWKKQQKFIQTLIIMVINYFAGFLISNGWWMLLLYSKFQNPYFPYYNDIFKSPYADLVSYMDVRHMPKNLMQWLFFPFYWGGYSYNNVTIEFANIDFRPIVLFVSCFFFSFVNLIFSKFNNEFSTKLKKYLNFDYANFLIIFLIFSYIIWLNTSATLRYIVTLEFLAGLFISLILLYFYILIKSKKITIIITLFVLFAILFTTKYPPLWMIRNEFQTNSIYAENLNLPDNAIVIILGGFPTQVFIPFQNQKAQFIYINGEIGYPFVYNKMMNEKISEIIDDSKKEKFLLYSITEPAPIDWNKVSKYINRNDFSCKKVQSSFKIPEYYFCKMKTKNE